jgi:peptide/nickel transport system permease protein
MVFKSILDHLTRRPIQATTTAAEVLPSQTVATEKSKGSKSNFAFYLRFFAKDKPGFVGLAIIAIFFAWALIEGIMQELAVVLHHASYGWLLLPSDPFGLYGNGVSASPPSLAHFPFQIFGTNVEGESLFSRILYAAPHDAAAPVIIVGSAILIGMFFGTFAGYVGGWLDEAIMRATDAFLSIPGLILAIVLAILLGSNFNSLLYALIIVWWPTYTRFFRAQALTLREKGYVESSKLSGASTLRIVLRHIVPNSIDPVIAYMTLDIGTIILVYASLAFLGIGVGFNYPEWGADSSAGLSFFPADWWWAIIPGAVIAIIVIAFTLAGDRLQDLVSGRMNY